MNRYKILFFTVVGLIVFAIRSSFRQTYDTIPIDWEIYTQQEEGYSFTYPKGLVVSECGNGEVIVASESVEQCLLPSNAPEEYLRKIYFQVFLPKPGLREFLNPSPWMSLDIPERLKDWQQVSWNADDLPFGGGNWVWDDAIPVKRGTITSFTRYNDPDNTMYLKAYSPNSISVGFVRNANQIENVKKSINSFRIF